jgi:deoxyribose-phosphate aldolase
MDISQDQHIQFSDLSAVPALDPVNVEAQAAKFEMRGVTSESRAADLQLAIMAITMVDLTTLEGSDTPEKVRAMCEKAQRPQGPDASDPAIPPVAAVCVYPTLVGVAARALEGSPVRVASVAAAFPSGQARISQKVSEIEYAVSEGADEIDIVISRGKFLSGEHHEVFDEICQCREACGDAHLKVILETGELETYDNIRLASEIAMAAGAHFIKTSTGKISPAATFPATLVMLQAIGEFHQRTGRMVGMKPAGGVRTADQARRYLSMVEDVLGCDWLTPEWFRFGASSLLNDLVAACREV